MTDRQRNIDLFSQVLKDPIDLLDLSGETLMANYRTLTKQSMDPYSKLDPLTKPQGICTSGTWPTLT